METCFKNTELPSRLPEWVTWIAFAVGLTGAVSLRLILIAKLYQPELIRLFWYIGIIGNMCFFLFRAFITYRRRRLILATGLMEKLKDRTALSGQDYQALKYLISSLYISKERWNYFVIFFFSFLAIGWDLWVSCFH